MRRSLEVLALLILAWLVWITHTALSGPERLPDRIPIHFDAAGNANGWGSPTVLLLLPAVAVGLYLLLTVISQFPSSFNFPVKATADNRAQLVALTLDLLAWMKVELLGMFGMLQRAILQASRVGQRHISAWLVPVFLVVLFGTMGWYMAGMVRASRGDGSDSSLPPGSVD